MITYGLALWAGILVGYLTTAFISRRRDVALFELLRPEIANTAPPTTVELSAIGVMACPRCHSTKMRAHGSTEAAGPTCLRCGWVRYADPYDHQLHNAPRQPRTIDEIRAGEVQSSTE